jgi:hypothetical protein
MRAASGHSVAVQSTPTQYAAFCDLYVSVSAVSIISMVSKASIVLL